ncbi:helix-turn-helix domain-containing protein [Curtobacterium sp. SP.BCo]|uniref:AraC family transcriptional regulator n=1 Tax=Curtobacterium sp. SP.BCo TaxID=3435229 RepID=UPI003F731741
MSTATADGPLDDVPTEELRQTSVRETVRSGTDPDEAIAFYRDVYASPDLAFVLDGRGFGFRYRATGDGRVSLRTSSVSVRRVGVLAPQRQYLLAWSVEGNVTIDEDLDEAVSLQPGVPVMLPAGRPFHVTAAPGTVHLVHFDADFLEAVAVVGSDAAPMPLAFPVTVSTERLAPLQAVLREIARPMLDVSVVHGDRAVLDLRLAEAALEAFRPVPEARGASVPVGTLARAKAFMYAHFDRSLAATDIAVAAEVSVRTLQEAFQRQEGSTPMGYLRDLRLEKARLGLQLADARETSVAAVAQSCGFRHMGRFSGAYFSTYGEYPGDTLRGRRRLIAVADRPERRVPTGG